MAWSTFVQCFVQFLSELLYYHSRIALIVVSHPYSVVYRFDQMHRMHLANNHHKRWDDLDEVTLPQMLVTSVTNSTKQRANLSSSKCFVCNKFGHWYQQCPRRSTRLALPSSTPAPNRDALCLSREQPFRSTGRLWLFVWYGMVWYGMVWYGYLFLDLPVSDLGNLGILGLLRRPNLGTYRHKTTAGKWVCIQGWGISDFQFILALNEPEEM